MCFPYCSENCITMQKLLERYITLISMFLYKYNNDFVYYCTSLFYSPVKSCNTTWLSLYWKDYEFKVLAPPQTKLELYKRKIYLQHGTHLYLLEYCRQGFNCNICTCFILLSKLCFIKPWIYEITNKYQTTSLLPPTPK